MVRNPYCMFLSQITGLTQHIRYTTSENGFLVDVTTIVCLSCKADFQSNLSPVQATHHYNNSAAGWFTCNVWIW
ncbi:hypothetical protein chiPu_0012635 [Chiloscyllium punctatum]|uniref:Uncharacterized protein n=1 Tax=Chiloscyllium punctatum TaxID=137246 RepID=A0A401SUU9_CHIPU|nr:hypothetical protein [Chiloscyllium punctatum]